MTRRRSIVILCATLCVASLSACMTSANPLDYRPALTPRGATGALQMVDGRIYSGELLSVRDSSFVMLMGQRVVIAYFHDLDRVSFEGFSSGEFGPRERPSEKTIEQARAVSRFPYGIAEPALKTLFERGRQTAPDTLRGTNR